MREAVPALRCTLQGGLSGSQAIDVDEFFNSESDRGLKKLNQGGARGPAAPMPAPPLHHRARQHTGLAPDPLGQTIAHGHFIQCISRIPE